MTGGSVQRTCTNSGLWDGVPPFCAGCVSLYYIFIFNTVILVYITADM